MKHYHESINKTSRLTRAPRPAVNPPDRLLPLSPSQLPFRIATALTTQNDYFPCFDWTFPPPITQKAQGTLSAEALFGQPFVTPGRYSLYLHIPFCASLCKFCYYPVIPGEQADQMQTYVSYLVREMALYAETLHGDRCESIYLGGGTPTHLGLAQLETLFEAIHQHFHLTDDAEITIEAAPGSLPIEKLTLLKSLGVNRLSYGIQTLDTQLLAGLNRDYSVPHAMAELESALWLIGNVNVDTMYGFEGESRKALSDTLTTFMDMGIPSLSIYALDNQRCDRDRVRFAPARDDLFEKKLALFHHASALLRARGYWPVLQNIFQRPDKASYRHQPRRWENLPLVALGMSSVGYAPRRLYQNHLSLKTYYASIDSGRLPIMESEPLDRPLELMREVVSQLRFTAVDLAGIRAKYGADIAVIYRDLINALIGLGYLEHESDQLRMTEKAAPYNNVIPMLFAPDDFKQHIFALPEEYRENFPLPSMLSRVGATQSAPFHFETKREGN